MERLVVKGTTRKPQLEAGRILLALVKTLHDPRNTEEVFRRRLLEYKDRYFTFLHEKSTSLATGETWYTHDELRKAFNSLYRFYPYLFNYTKNINIPRTSNSIEGHFSHVRDIVQIHRGLTKERTQKVLSLIFLCSTIAPSQEKLDEIFK